MWESVTGKNPSYYKDSKKFPVESVSWHDCQKYIKKLNSLQAAPKGYKFSLPTEEQWEYACRAGTTTPFHFGNKLNGEVGGYQANCAGNYPRTDGKKEFLRRTMEVGSFPANDWGLYDMHGNVWEWCMDWKWNLTSAYRSQRGGSGRNDAYQCRSATRAFSDPKQAYNNNGLRLAIIPKN